MKTPKGKIREFNFRGIMGTLCVSKGITKFYGIEMMAFKVEGMPSLENNLPSAALTSW